jgi:hypothetical protein
MFTSVSKVKTWNAHDSDIKRETVTMLLTAFDFWFEEHWYCVDSHVQITMRLILRYDVAILKLQQACRMQTFFKGRSKSNIFCLGNAQCLYI